MSGPIRRRREPPVGLRFLNFETRRNLLRAFTPEIRCWRCGAVADVDWCEITSMADTAPQYVPGGHVLCPTPGCFSWDGTKSTAAEPESPAELQRLAGQVMDRLWRRATT